jgi:hypothetical protein
MSSVVAQAGPELPVAFQLVFLLVPLLIAVFALVMAAFPHRMTRWQMRGPDGTTQVEPGRTRILVIRSVESSSPLSLSAWRSGRS